MRLSRRLQAVADMVTRGNTVADIGCDHGYVSIYLVENKITPKVIAMDVNKGPLKKAEAHIKSHSLEAYIETRLSDGTRQLREREAETLICAGMGGKLTVRILEDGSRKVALMKELILQPQSEIRLVRQFLRKHGFLITQEDMVFEEGKYYPMMKAQPEAALQEEAKEAVLWDAYGEKLLKSKNKVLQEFLLQKQQALRGLVLGFEKDGKKTIRQMERREELEAELKLIAEALEVMSL